MKVTIYEAKTHLSRLIAAVERGEEVVISRRDKPVARLIAEKAVRTPRKLGFLAHVPNRIDGFFGIEIDAVVASDFEDALTRSQPAER